MIVKTLEDLDRRRAEAVKRAADPEGWDSPDEFEIRCIAAVRDADAANGLQVYREGDVQRLVDAALALALRLQNAGASQQSLSDVSRAVGIITKSPFRHTTSAAERLRRQDADTAWKALRDKFLNSNAQIGGLSRQQIEAAAALLGIAIGDAK